MNTSITHLDRNMVSHEAVSIQKMETAINVCFDDNHWSLVENRTCK